MDETNKFVESPEGSTKVRFGLKPDPELTPDEIKKRYEAALKDVAQARREYAMNRVFVAGHQWIKWSKTDKAYVPWRRSGDRYQGTYNKLAGLLNDIVSKLMKAQQTFEVPASSADDYALTGSLLSESILREKQLEEDWELKREELFVATLTGGTAALATEWDAWGKSYGRIPAGDTINTVLPITEFCVESGAREAKLARYWMKAQVLPAEQVQATFNLEEKPRGDYGSGLPYAKGLMGQDSVNQGVLVITYYERPNPLRPQGAVVVMVNDQIVFNKKWYFPFKHLNLEVMRDEVVPGTWIGEARLSKARPVQISYNFVQSNIDEHIKAVGTAKLAAPFGSSEIFDQMSDNPAEPIRYPDGATPPHYLQAPNMPSYMIQRLDHLKAEMDDIMNQHGVSRGEAPGRVDSGYGLSILSENDASPIGRLSKEGARVWQNTATNDLELLATRVKDSRETTVLEDKSDIAHSIKWKGSDLAGQTRAIIPPDSIIPRSRAQMQQWAETMANMGLTAPGREGELTTLLEIAEIPGRDQVLSFTDPQEARARRDVYRLAEGEIVIPRDFHNHKNAIKVGNRFRNSPRYETLPEDRRSAVDDWIQAHETMDAEEAGQMTARAAVSPALANAATANEATPLPPQMTAVPPELQRMEAEIQPNEIPELPEEPTQGA